MLDLTGQFAAALMMVGEVGFLLMMLEGGLEVDVPMLLQVGKRGLGVALVGQSVSVRKSKRKIGKRAERGKRNMRKEEKGT